jgi:hypothetical protein
MSSPQSVFASLHDFSIVSATITELPQHKLAKRHLFRRPAPSHPFRSQPRLASLKLRAEVHRDPYCDDLDEKWKVEHSWEHER